MASEKERIFEAALSAVLNEVDMILKKPQETALKAFLLGNDVSAVLPTGFGKSLIYQLAPLVAKKMDTNSNPVVVVVSPLVALMEQQVKEASKLGVTAMQLGVNSEEEIVSASPMLLFGSPESWILNEKWRNLLSTTKDLLGIVVDEVHLMYKWGQGEKGTRAFRECFSRLCELRSIVKTGTPILTLTASADLEARARVQKLLLLDNPTMVNESPNRKNIRIGLKQHSGVSMDCLDWVRMWSLCFKRLEELGGTALNLMRL
ncbi:hypothetical protein WMY93_012699 [Mugilogobius chulae]|uniref:Helicase ATP-binding domain-containing protein n=1 Tax=Mugilogobius chulae TaxID=88201 RepID=A0AAW0NZJ1_9GOBI